MANPLQHRRVLLGISGSVAAYKSAEIARLLSRGGAEVRVVMTPAAETFITPLTMQAVCGRPVYRDGEAPQAAHGMDHVELARWCDLALVAPASADCVARLSLGLGGGLLADVCLALQAPLLVAPAMNRGMWEHAATREHAARLRERGVELLGPDSGEQACGETGPGRMMEPEAIVDAVAHRLAPSPLANRRLLITAGPTREPIDAVRCLTNHSSGRMGYAIAAAAAAAGAQVTLISGPVALDTPPGVRRTDVTTAAEMHHAVLAAAGTDLFIGTAAVSDFRTTEVAEHKLTREHGLPTLRLDTTEDVLAAAATLKPRPFVVGFAAETRDLEANARRKLRAKGVDMMVANLVGAGQGFGDVDTELLVLWAGGSRRLPRGSKGQSARRLIEVVTERYHAQGTDPAARLRAG